MPSPVTFGKLSIFHNSPDWRYRIFISNSQSLRHYLRRESQPTVTANYSGAYLMRFLGLCNITLKLSETAHLNSEFIAMVETLDPELRDKFNRLQSKLLRKRRERKFTVSTTDNLDSPKLAPYVQWRVKDLDAIHDEWIVRLMKTMSGVEYNEAIAVALTIKADEHCQEVFRYIGYSIFLGKSDQEIGVKWQLKPSYVQAIRMLFFDFTRLPKDPVAKLTFFRQLVINGKLTDSDFEFYKLLNDLGDIGLKSIINNHLLTPTEQLVIENYLGNAMVENVLKLKMSVRTLKDSLNFNNVLNMLGNFYIKKAEIGLTGAKVKNLEASTKKIETDLGNIVKGGQEHEKLFDTVKNMESTVRMLSLIDSPIPEYKPITDLK
jgi:hypothetical protein